MGEVTTKTIIEPKEAEETNEEREAKWAGYLLIINETLETWMI